MPVPHSHFRFRFLNAEYMGILSLAEGDDEHAKVLLETYLAEYQKVLKTPLLTMVNPAVTKVELEN